MGIRDFVRILGPARQSHLTDAGFEETIRPHLQAMARLAARIAPQGAGDDVVQESLLRAWRHRTHFDPGRGSLAGWLLAIVANEARRTHSRQRRPVAVATLHLDLTPDARLDLAAALARLPARQRLAVDCFYYAGLTVAETASVMGCSEGTVKSTLADARARLQLDLQER